MEFAATQLVALVVQRGTIVVRVWNVSDEDERCSLLDVQRSRALFILRRQRKCREVGFGSWFGGCRELTLRNTHVKNARPTVEANNVIIK